MQIPLEWVGRASGLGLLCALILSACIKPLMAYVCNPRHRFLAVSIGASLFLVALFCAAFITDSVHEHTDAWVLNFLFAYFTCAPVGLLGVLMVFGATTSAPASTIK